MASVLMLAPGDQLHSIRPLNWLLKRGWFVHFSDSLNPFPNGTDRFAFHPYPLPRGERMFSRLFGRRAGSELSAWTSVVRMKRLWKRAKRPVTHIHWVDRRAYCAAKAGIRPLVLTVWGSDINNCLNGDAGSIISRQVGAALRLADLVIIDSGDMHAKCAEIAGQTVRTELLTLGVDTRAFDPNHKTESLEWRKKLSISAESVVFVSMRGWSPLYRHDAILRAFARAVPRLSRPAVLVLKVLRRSSADRERYQTEMKHLVEQLGIAQHVRWLDEVPFERLPEIYCFANAIINYPSKDAFPVTFLEAAACQTPVITCSHPAYLGTFAEEFFEPFSDSDEGALTNAIAGFVAGHSLQRGQRLVQLRARVCREHDEEVVADRLVDIYQKISAS